MKKSDILCLSLLLLPFMVRAVGPSGMYLWSVALKGYISTETGKAPNAYLWIPERPTPDPSRRSAQGDASHLKNGGEPYDVKFAVLAQQNMTEEMIFKSPVFRERMRELGGALIWVTPWFSQNWDPTTGCQQTFEEMMVGLAGQSGHPELERVPIVPLGHSAQATFPWNFAAWNPERTLCIISFHGDAPRTNLCGYGTANVEWGRKRNIDGIPGLMIEGEYEWWEARVRPALAFQMMYPNSCISFLCDAGSGHFECMPETAEYIAKFIEKAIQYRKTPLPNKAPLPNRGGVGGEALNPQDGWLACRYNPDLQPNDGDGAKDDIFAIAQRPKSAPYADYQGDRHDAFWYFDREMAELTEARYAETRGKKTRTIEVGAPQWSADGKTLTITAPKDVRIEVISGPLRKVSSRGWVFEVYPYEAGLDNPKRSFSSWLIAIRDGDKNYKRAVKPIEVKLPKQGAQ